MITTDYTCLSIIHRIRSSSTYYDLIIGKLICWVMSYSTLIINLTSITAISMGTNYIRSCVWCVIFWIIFRLFLLINDFRRLLCAIYRENRLYFNLIIVVTHHNIMILQETPIGLTTIKKVEIIRIISRHRLVRVRRLS